MIGNLRILSSELTDKATAQSPRSSSVFHSLCAGLQIIGRSRILLGTLTRAAVMTLGLGAVTGSANLVSRAFAGVLGALMGVREVFLIAGGIAVLAGLMALWVFGGGPRATPAPE